MHPLLLVLGLLAPVGFYIMTFMNNVRKRKNDPHELPGPTLLPYLGRIHDLPIKFMWLKFEEWAKVYGPIYRTEMLGAKFIIISDEKIAEDLLVKRAKYNSDRPAVPSLFDSKSTHGSMEYLPLMGHNRRITFSELLLSWLTYCRILGPPTSLRSRIPYPRSQRIVLRLHGLRGQALDVSPGYQP